jgi:hypothetical protein
MGKSIYLSNAFLGLALGAAAWTPPPTVYLGLFLTPETATGGGTEVSGGSYARIAIPNNGANFSAPTAGTVTNLTLIAFAGASASWGTIPYAATFDALTGGNLLYFGSLATPKPVTIGDVFTVPPGGLVFSEL